MEPTTALLRRREVLPEKRMIDVAFSVTRVFNPGQQTGRLGEVHKTRVREEFYSPPPLNLSAAWRAIFSRVDSALTYASSAALRPFT